MSRRRARSKTQGQNTQIRRKHFSIDFFFAFALFIACWWLNTSCNVFLKALLCSRIRFTNVFFFLFGGTTKEESSSILMDFHLFDETLFNVFLRFRASFSIYIWCLFIGKHFAFRASWHNAKIQGDDVLLMIRKRRTTTELVMLVSSAGWWICRSWWCVMCVRNWRFVDGILVS